MRKNCFLSLLSLFLLVPASITRAQTISSQKGLTTAVFPTQYGSVKVYLPDDGQPGDVISGTVIAEPKGNNARQTEKNLAELVKYSVSIDGNKFAVTPNSSSFKWLVHQDRQISSPIELLYVSGFKAHELTYQFKPPAKEPAPRNSGCVIPSHALTASPVRIPGSFDGDMTNTQCLLNNQPMQVLAESPSQCQVQYPQNGQGVQTMQVSENGKQFCTKQVSGVQLNVSAGKLNLNKGENTYVDVNITGLQGLSDTCTLTVINTTPGVVTMSPSNNVIIPLIPDSMRSGTFNRRFDINSIRTGGFIVNVEFSMPEDWLNPYPDDGKGPICKCSVSATIVKKTINSPRPTFAGVVQKSCAGDPQICGEGTVEQLWEIVSGKENAEIVDESQSKPIVTIQPKNTGKFILKLIAINTCGSGIFCTDEKFCNENGDEVPSPVTGEKPDKPKIEIEPGDPKNPIIWDSLPPPVTACVPSLNHSGTPLMEGGLRNTFIGPDNSKTIRRDDFIVLEADGVDFDMAEITCTKIPDCLEPGCVKKIPIEGRVKFEWEATSEKGKEATRGSFVQIGCIPDDTKTKGEHVIFKPPYLQLPVVKADTTIFSTVVLSVIDAGSPVPDDTIKKTISIAVTRSKGAPDYYSVVITGGEYNPQKSVATTPPAPLPPGCTCKPFGPAWTPGDDLKVPDIILPAASKDNDKLVQGQWVMIGTQDQTDMDIATYGCTTTCPTTTLKKSYNDIIRWKWKVEGGGRILLSDSSQYIVYEAPKEFPGEKEFLDIKITVEVHNPPGRNDDSKEFTAVKVFRVYRPGIRLHYPPEKWLPKENEGVEIKSELVYQSGESWLPAFDHTCRIQYFELMKVSREKGVCMNYPVPEKADYCFDLQFKKEKNLEVFAPAIQTSDKCKLKDQFMQARTEKPVKDYFLKIHSLDYGGYGFVRSFANINKGMAKDVDKGRDIEPVVYPSIPWKIQEVLHPLRSEFRAMEREYLDNRVTIPRDVDENHVNDSGWITRTGIEIMDPLFIINNTPTDEEIKDAKRKKQVLLAMNDLDSIPVGDGFRGDGLGSYEEYRGFKVMSGGKEIHVRTDPGIKDIFVCNEGKFILNLYRTVSGLGVYEINQPQFISTQKRWINFNNTPNTHVVDQMGLYLIDGGDHKKLLGIAIPINGASPTIPNFENKIIIYKISVKRHVDNRNEAIDKINNDPAALRIYNPDGEKLKRLDLDQKMAAVVAHELLHGNNVCHHGEGDEALEISHDAYQGLRSGNIECVMHYDNSGFFRDTGYIPEPIGNILCKSDEGTGYNSPENKLKWDREINLDKDKKKVMWFGPTAEGRGNCETQIRVSGREGKPGSCGDRFGEDGNVKNEFKNKPPDKK